MSTIYFRCDGGPRVGAGHVARCLQIALACRVGGHDVGFAGSFDGVAALLLEHEGVDVRQRVDGHADAVVVDSYDMPGSELDVYMRSMPVVTVSDGGLPARGTLVLDYHPDAQGAQLCGPDYAPVSPRCVATRRERGFERALVTIGGGEGGAAVSQVAKAALHDKGLQVLEPRGSPGIYDELAQADVAISGSGVTAYELACAGVPAGLIPLVDNQKRVARTFGERGLALAGDDPASLAEGLSDARLRAALAAAGPAAIDGYGAFRVRDAIAAALAGKSAPPVLRYRPATADDSARQLEWRNDHEARAASWSTDEVDPGEHAVWFEGVLGDPQRTLFVIEGAAGPSGSVRFDADGEEAEISVIVAPGLRGEGIGSRAIRESCELYLAAHPMVKAVRAEIREHNTRSAAAFTRVGFARVSHRSPEERPVFTLDRAALASGSA
jgi:spore coat polysaccharide biosynthesis predicted glycosyltransferase SpsG/RimJ/RimL family protein N-acetyltransferase